MDVDRDNNPGTYWSPFYGVPKPADPLWRIEDYLIVRCAESGLVYLSNPLTEDALKEFYSLKYFEGDSKSKGYATYAGDEAVLRANFCAHLALLLRTIAQQGVSPGNLSLLDFGCAYGYFLDEARSAFRDVRGIELNEEVARVGKERFNLPIESRPDALENAGPGSLDVITMWDVIEHLPAPRASLNACSRSLRPGGYLFLTTGDIDSLLARALGKRWRLVNPPQHICYFSKATLTRLLDACGFDVVDTQYTGRRVSLRFMLYILCYLTGFSYARLPKWLSAGAPWHVHVNLFDVMFIAARRRD